jgi:hypothetical protein
MDDDDPDLKLGEVLLELDASVNRHQHVKRLLRDREKRPVFECIPTLLMHGGGVVVAEEQLNARVYALVNEDAHSRSWLLAKSSTARTCSREVGA